MNRATITSLIKTHLSAVTTAGGYNNDFANVKRWMTYPGDSSETFWVNIQDGRNQRRLDEGYREGLNIRITASFVINDDTTAEEEEALYVKAESIIEDIIECLDENKAAYETAVSETAFYFEFEADEISIDRDGDGGIVVDAIVDLIAHHKFEATGM